MSLFKSSKSRRKQQFFSNYNSNQIMAKAKEPKQTEPAVKYFPPTEYRDLDGNLIDQDSGEVLSDVESAPISDRQQQLNDLEVTPDLIAGLDIESTSDFIFGIMLEGFKPGFEARKQARIERENAETQRLSELRARKSYLEEQKEFLPTGKTIEDILELTEEVFQNTVHPLIQKAAELAKGLGEQKATKPSGKSESGEAKKAAGAAQFPFSHKEVALAWLAEFSLPFETDISVCSPKYQDKADEITEKFMGFKKWAKAQIEAL